MRNGLRRVAALAGGAMVAVSMPAQAEKLDIARAFASPSLNGPTAQAVSASPDGSLVAYVQPAKDDPKAAILWVMPAAGGKPRALLDSRKVAAADSGGGISEARMKLLDRRHSATADALDYRWSSAGDRLLLSHDDDLHLVRVDTGAITRLTRDETLELDPQFAPGGKHVSFVRGAQLILKELATGKEDSLCPDGAGAVSCGTSEFVAQEEMQRFTGAWWAPDGNRIAFTRVDEARVGTIPRVRIDSAAVSVVDDRYPLTGTPNAIVELFVRAASGGAPVKVDLGPSDDIYIFNAAWAKDGGTLYVQRQSRDQKRLDLLAVDPGTGASRVILTETADTWVDLERDFRPLADGNFLWGSTRTGWRHLYLYDGEGKLIRPVTSGDWRIGWVGPGFAPDASPIVGVDETSGDVWIATSRETPLEQHLYRVSYRAPGEPVRVTQGAGWWSPVMTTGRPKAFIGRYSDPLTPPNTALYGLDGKRIAWISENRLDASHPFAPYRDQAPSHEFGTIKAATGEDLHWVMARPAGFDPAKRYPVVVRVYGGPGVQTVRRQWGSRTEQLWTQAGYIVFQLDNRGSANRSRTFEHALYHDLGGANSADQIAGVSYLKTLPFVDAGRIGIFGWSFGGYMTYRLLTTPGSGVAAGAAGGVPSAFELYDTHYTERFLGTPQAFPVAYRTSNLKGRAGTLDRPLMLLHGMSDDNVVLTNFTALVAELQASGKLFETVVYPGQSHVLRGEPILRHQLESYMDFFARRMPEGTAK